MTITSIETANFAKTSNVSFLLRILNWLAKHDGAYRENAKLKAMPQERLEDMGINRAVANRAFCQQ